MNPVERLLSQELARLLDRLATSVSEGSLEGIRAANPTLRARLDDADDRGRTALMIAAELGHAAVVELLIKHGASTALRDHAGKTALDLATNEAVRRKLIGH